MRMNSTESSNTKKYIHGLMGFLRPAKIARWDRIEIHLKNNFTIRVWRRDYASNYNKLRTSTSFEVMTQLYNNNKIFPELIITMIERVNWKKIIHQLSICSSYS